MWILLVIVATFIWAICNFIDKEITEKRLPSMGAYYAFRAVTSILLVLGILVFLKEFAYLPNIYIGMLILGGSFYAVGMWFYLKALKIDEASYVVPLFHIEPIWLGVLAFFLLGEALVGLNLIAFLVILLGGLVLSVNQLSTSNLTLRPALGLMVLTTFFMSLTFLTFKYVHELFPDVFWTIYAWQLLGQGLGGFLLMIFFWEKGLLKHIKAKVKPVFPLFAFNRFISFVAFGFYFVAFSLAPAALVGAVGGMQGFFVFLIGLFMTHFYPDLVSESMNRAVIWQKIIGILIMLSGIALLI